MGNNLPESNFVNPGKDRKFKIVFLISSLNTGGAERVMARLANFMADKNHSVSIIIFNNIVRFDMNEKVDIIHLDTGWKQGGIFSILNGHFNRMKVLTTRLKDLNPDVMISFMTSTNVIGILASRLTGIPVIVSDRISPYVDDIKPIYKLLRKLVYRFANTLVIQTKAVSPFYKNLIKNILIIPNPVDAFFDRSEQALKYPNVILNVGRLADQKNQQFLIEAFAAVQNKEWELWILGEGKKRALLEKTIRENNCENRVKLHGRKQNVEHYYQNCAFFVLSSLNEGYPNVLIEAMANKMPVISTDCEYGPAEIIEDNVSGILLKSFDRTELTQAIQFFIDNPDFRISCAEKAFENVQLNAIGNIVQMWEDAIAAIVPAS